MTSSISRSNAHVALHAPFETASSAFSVRLPGVAVWPLPLPVSESRAEQRAPEAAQLEVDVLNARLFELEAAVASWTSAPPELLVPLDVARGAAQVLGFSLVGQREQIAQLDAELGAARTAARRAEDELSTALAHANERAATAEAHAALGTSELLAMGDRVSELERREAHLALRLSGAHTRALDAEQARAALEARVAELAAQVDELEREVAEHVRRSLDPRANDGERAHEALEARAVKLEEHVAELTRHSAELVGAA